MREAVLRSTTDLRNIHAWKRRWTNRWKSRGEISELTRFKTSSNDPNANRRRSHDRLHDPSHHHPSDGPSHHPIHGHHPNPNKRSLNHPIDVFVQLDGSEVQSSGGLLPWSRMIRPSRVRKRMSKADRVNMAGLIFSQLVKRERKRGWWLVVDVTY